MHKCLCWLFFLVHAFCQHAKAADTPNLLVLGTATKPVAGFQGDVAERLGSQFSRRGFDTYDFKVIPGLNKRRLLLTASNAQLLNMARSIESPPIDIVLVFKLDFEPSVRGQCTGQLSLNGKLINVNSGRVLEHLNIENTVSVTTRNHSHKRYCSTPSFVRQVNHLSDDFGYLMSQKLEKQASGNYDKDEKSEFENALVTEYVLRFVDFNKEEVLAMEEYLVLFGGYKSHRLVTAHYSNMEYWYRSRSGTARLDRNLSKVLQKSGIYGHVAFDRNTYTVYKISNIKL